MLSQSKYVYALRVSLRLLSSCFLSHPSSTPARLPEPYQSNTFHILWFLFRSGTSHVLYGRVSSCTLCFALIWRAPRHLSVRYKILVSTNTDESVTRARKEDSYGPTHFDVNAITCYGAFYRSCKRPWKWTSRRKLPRRRLRCRVECHGCHGCHDVSKCSNDHYRNKHGKQTLKIQQLLLEWRRKQWLEGKYGKTSKYSSLSVNREQAVRRDFNAISCDTGARGQPINRTTGSVASVPAIASRWSYCYDVIIQSKLPLIHRQTRSAAHGNFMSGT